MRQQKLEFFHKIFLPSVLCCFSFGPSLTAIVKDIILSVQLCRRDDESSIDSFFVAEVTFIVSKANKCI